MITKPSQAFTANLRLFPAITAKPTAMHRKNGSERSQAGNKPNSNVMRTNSPTSKIRKREHAKISVIPNILAHSLSKMTTYSIFSP
jgi:hypothetical protein